MPQPTECLEKRAQMSDKHTPRAMHKEPISTECETTRALYTKQRCTTHKHSEDN